MIQQQYDNRAFNALSSEGGQGDIENSVLKSESASHPNVYVYPAYIQQHQDSAVPGFKQTKKRYILCLAVTAIVLLTAITGIAVFTTVSFTSEDRPPLANLHHTNISKSSQSTITASSNTHTSLATPSLISTSRFLKTDLPKPSATAPSSNTQGYSTLTIATAVSLFDEGCGYRPMVDPGRLPQARVIGGATAPQGSWPWVGSLQNNHDGHICGAVLIDRRFALTAAHCLEDENVDELLIVFGTNTDDTSAPSTSRLIVSINHAFVDPSFHPDEHDYDFAVLELRQRVPYTEHIYPACLPARNLTVEEGTMCSIAGWGKISADGRYPSHLQEAQVPIISREVCDEYISGRSKPMTERMFCAGYHTGGIDACTGDSGGPLVCQLDDSKWYVYGIISWGYGCALPRLPGFYTKVNEFYDVLQRFTGLDLP